MVEFNNDRGRITIDNDVLSYLAGEAATGCFGVKGMVACNKEGGPWQLLRREAMNKGIVVLDQDDGSVSLELHIGVDRGINMLAVSRSIMNEVRYKLDRASGIPIKSVDVFIDTIIG